MSDTTNKGFCKRFAGIYTRFMARNESAYVSICNAMDTYITAEKRVLDLAGGTGQITFLMDHKADLWIATDYSENMVEEAKKRKESSHPFCKAHFEVADATNLQYEDGTFDVVVVANALHIMPDSWSALREIYRVLKDDGVVIAPTFVYDPGYSRLVIWLMEKAGFKTYHKWTREEYAAFMMAGNFAAEEELLVKGKLLNEYIWIERKRG